ncbi:AC transposable element-derived protein 4 [Colletotrichum sojae]|uniref:AC transposable element-derived protein 4 n=1 Tax=Colletotrichum sojae TaxID=2175907 RepID=A0A8H6JIY8_9PEZI|nr:AC transposable element-derived protein 4 [Colletotrichum sojae]
MSSIDSDASEASVRSCIVVEVLPEDLVAACTADCTPERCDNSTVRPHEPPAIERGPPGSLIPFDVPARPREIRNLPANPLDLFFQYIPRDFVERWAEWTNVAPLPKEGPRARTSRVYRWRKTSADEIYLFLGILLYMGIHYEPQISDLMPDIYRKVNEWSVHIQETGDSFYLAGSDLTVDEAMVRFTGRSLQTTTIPTKPIPTGFKIWILAQSGYCLRWLWHVHIPQARPSPGEAGKQAALTPTQRVVTTLVALLPAAIYHVFLDNLFASIQLFRALRKQRIGASGTCRKDSVNQFTWKDNALVLFLTTVFQDGREVIRNRRRPAGDSAAKRAVRQVFGPDVRKDLPVPEPINEYNHKMNGVDTSDQMRSYYQYGRPIRRGGWQSIAWNFLLEVIVVNSFFLQLWGEPNWRTVKSQYHWRQLLAAQLIQQFGPLAKARQRSRPKRANDKKNTSIPWQQHRKGSRGINSPCSYCGSRKALRREALSEISGNNLTRKKTRKGCLDCNVASCIDRDCWYLWHTQNL